MSATACAASDECFSVLRHGWSTACRLSRSRTSSARPEFSAHRSDRDCAPPGRDPRACRQARRRYGGGAAAGRRSPRRSEKVPSGRALDREHQLMLLRRDARAIRGRLAERKKFSQLPAEFRERLIIRFRHSRLFAPRRRLGRRRRFRIFGDQRWLLFWRAERRDDDIENPAWRSGNFLLANGRRLSSVPRRQFAAAGKRGIEKYMSESDIKVIRGM